MIIGSSKGKLISNNISRSQAITETLGKRLDSTAENTKKQVQRQGSNTATDRDTKKSTSKYGTCSDTSCGCGDDISYETPDSILSKRCG